MRRERPAADHGSSAASATAGIFREIVVELVQRGPVHGAVKGRGTAAQAAQLRVPRQGVHGDVASPGTAPAAGMVWVGQCGHREGRRGWWQAEGLGGTHGRRLLRAWRLRGA